MDAMGRDTARHRHGRRHLEGALRERVLHQLGARARLRARVRVQFRAHCRVRVSVAQRRRGALDRSPAAPQRRIGTRGPAAHPGHVTLSGKSVLITGGKRMGAALAQALARQGADVALTWHRSRAESDEAASIVRSAGRRALSIQADLSTARGCDLVVADVEQAFGRLDALIHLASLYRNVPFDDLTPEIWDAQLAVDLRSTFLCARAAVPAMRRVGGGRIIAFADWVAASGRPRYPGYLPYYVAKAGVIALVEALALELASDNILVNAVAPGPILPPDELTADERRAVEAATPLGRWGGTEEIVKAVLFLLDTGFVTGDVIRVDGGRHVR